MKTPLKILGAVALLLVLLFVGPIVYKAGQRRSMYLNCDDCRGFWTSEGNRL